jgi:bifunctional non-homologous end joining protein LigD
MGEWVFEPKLDGFRSIAYVEDGACRLVSRNRNAFQTFDPLAQAIGEQLAGHSAILDGEIVRPGPDGRPMFYELMRRRGPFCFYAFDLLWLDGIDLRDRPLLERKRLLPKLLLRRAQPVLYVDHVESGSDLFRIICEQDMEGVVAKQASACYTPEAGELQENFLRLEHIIKSVPDSIRWAMMGLLLPPNNPSKSSISRRSAASRETAASKMFAVAIFLTRRNAFLTSSR